MQYLVHEVEGRNLYTSREAKAFNTIQDVIRYLQKSSKSKRLFVGESELSREILEELLKEKLSTASVSGGPNEGRKWIVTAF